MSKKKAAGAGASSGLLSVETLRSAIVNGVKTLDLNSLLRTISAEDKNNPNTMNFLGAWSKLFNDQVHRANAQQLAEVLYHLGRLGYYNDNLLHNIVDETKLKSADLGSREISQCLYGLGKLKFCDQEFLDQITQRFLRNSSPIEPIAIANLIFGVSKLEYYDQKFLDKFANIAIAHMAELNSHDIAETLLGIAKIGYRNQDLLNALITRVSDRDFDQQSLINSSYALTMVLRNNNPENPEQIKDLIVGMVQGIDCNQVRSIEGKRQLSSIYYALDEGRRAAIGDLANKLDTSWDIEIEQNARATTTISNTQADMANYVRTLARDAQEEFYIRELGSSVDIYLPLINAVIQVDGPKHFHSSNNLETNATTKFNSQRISELGYNLLRVRVDDVNYEDVIKNFISKALAPIKAAKKAARSSYRAQEMSYEEFEANFAGLAMVSSENIAVAEAGGGAKATSSSVAREEEPKAKPEKASKKKNKKTATKVVDDFDLAIAEHMGKLSVEGAPAKKVEPVATNQYRSQMIEAVMNKNIVKVRQLLKQGASPNATENIDSHLSALCIACINQDLEIVKLLLDAGANPDITNEEGTTALFAAAYINNEVGTEIVKLLLNNGAHANTARENGETPLMQACFRNEKSAILILQAGANPNAVNKDNLCALHVASNRGCYDFVEALADTGANLDIMYAGKLFSPLASAIEEKDYRMVKLLLAKGANPNLMIKDTNLGIEINCLIYSASNNLDVEYARSFIDAGADVNALSTGKMPGLSAMGFAIRRENVEVVKLLLASGVDINRTQDESYLTQ